MGCELPSRGNSWKSSALTRHQPADGISEPILRAGLDFLFTPTHDSLDIRLKSSRLQLSNGERRRLLDLLAAHLGWFFAMVDKAFEFGIKCS